MYKYKANDQHLFMYKYKANDQHLFMYKYKANDQHVFMYKYKANDQHVFMYNKRQTINIYSLSVYHWSRLNTMLAVDGALQIQYLFLSFVDSHVETVTNALTVSTNKRHTINTFSQSVCPPGSG